MEAPNLIVSVSGAPKTGKTHISLSFPAPLLLFSFDIGYEPVLAKYEGKEIEVKTYPIPIIDSVKPTPYAREIYQQFTKDYKQAIEGTSYKTVVVDTATALYELGRHCRAEELRQENLLQFQYGEVYARLTAVITRARLAGVNLVLTHYMREKYVGNEGTGEMELDGFKRTEGLVDIVLETRRETRVKSGKGGGKDTIIVTRIKDNRYDLSLNEKELEMANYDDLLALLGVG